MCRKPKSVNSGLRDKDRCYNIPGTVWWVGSVEPNTGYYLVVGTCRSP